VDDGAWLRLHEVRVRGRLDAADDGATRALLAAGYATRTGRGLVATAEGRAAHATWARLPAGSDAERAVHAMYEAFLPLNHDLLRLCHDWQAGPGDERVLARLETLDGRVGPLLRRLRSHVPRLARYRPMLAAARDHVVGGDGEWLTSPRLDSYHTVWMLLHEDLLLALGLERGVSG
jgi:hypothetical protein